VLCPPGLNHRLRGLPFGWSRVVLFAVRRPHTGLGYALESSYAACFGGVVASGPRRGVLRRWVIVRM
jgi:hypothetical protein